MKKISHPNNNSHAIPKTASTIACTDATLNHKHLKKTSPHCCVGDVLLSNQDSNLD